MRPLKRLFAAIDRGVEACVAAIFAAMCVVGLLQVFNRFVLNKSLSWSEEFQIYCHVWIVFLAIPIAYRRGAHSRSSRSATGSPGARAPPSTC